MTVKANVIQKSSRDPQSNITVHSEIVVCAVIGNTF